MLYYHRNQQYSIYALTDSSGTVSERYAYTAYGQPTFLNASATVQTSSAANNRYTYTAREWDAILGVYHFRARWMSGLTGRFLTRDPIGYVDGRNFYQSYLNLVKTDPSGNKCCLLFWAGTGLSSSSGSGTGHIALKCGSDADKWPSANSDYYSFGAGPTESDDRYPPKGRAPDKMQCFSCQLDETKIRNAWKASYCDRTFYPIGQNCSTTFTQLIQAGMPSCPPLACPCNTEFICRDTCAGDLNNNGPAGIDRPETAYDYALCVEKNNCSPRRSWCSRIFPEPSYS